MTPISKSGVIPGYTWNSSDRSSLPGARVTHEAAESADVLADGRFVEAHTREFPYVHLQKKKDEGFEKK